MDLTKEQKVKLYANMVRVRKLDEFLSNALARGKLILFFHSQRGQEAVGVGACTFLNKDDYILPAHRGHGISKTIPKGIPAKAIIAEHYGKATGCCGGISRFHTADMKLGVPGMSGTLGGDFVIAAGLGIAAKRRGKGQVVVCLQGDGTYGRGTFHETVLTSAKWKLPIVFIIENNQFITFTPTCEVFPKDDLADFAFGYGISGDVIDGQDVMAVCEAVQTAIERARQGDGPSLLECKTYRVRPHAENLPDLKGSKIRPPEEIDTWLERDPIDLCQESLLRDGLITETEIERIDREAEEEIKEAERFAEESPSVGPETLKDALYAD